LIIDDYESLQGRLEEFLLNNFIRELEQANFNTLLIILGRDRLTDTHTAWRQHHRRNVIDEIILNTFSKLESEEYVRSYGINDDKVIAQMIEATDGFPFLLASEVEDYIHGRGSAVSLKNYYDRITRWMTPEQKEWLEPLCFLDVVNEDTIAAMLPDQDAKKVLEWFKVESSVRNPHSQKWVVQALMKSKIKEYINNDSPKRFRSFEDAASRVNT
jgi:hypothetical protein